MKEFLVIGVDVSKATLDMCFKPSGLTMQISNDLPGFKNWYRESRKILSSAAKTMVVMEHTGSYSNRFEKFLRSEDIEYCKVSALQIKRSLGVIRGKNDKVDAVRIAEYGWLRKDQLKADESCSEHVMKLKSLLSLRSKMVRDRSGYRCRLKEIKNAGDYLKSDPVIRIHNKIIITLTTEIKTVEKQIRELIKSNKELAKTSELIRSIKGVGEIVAAYMICYTNNFKRFSKARKFNCYAGLAPFKYESGTSIRGKARVSHLANKEAKTLLTLAARSAIRHDKELKKYYDKRVAAGMKKMSCLNIIRSKIVSRIFAVAKRQTPFVQLAFAA
jgi:transposase